MRALLAEESRHAVFRFRSNALNASVVQDTFPKCMNLCFPGLYKEHQWVKSPNLYSQFHNGSQIWFSGLDDSDRVEKILGQEYATLYFNECSQIPWPSVVTAKTRLAQKAIVKKTHNSPARELALKCYYDFNPPSKRHWTYQQFIEHRDPVTKQAVRDEFDYAYMTMNPKGNMANLSPAYLAILEDLPEKARNRFLLGLFSDDSDGSLWTEEHFELGRWTDPLPQMLRIVVAVDPSGSSGPEDFRSDEVGIVVVGLGVDGKGYVIEDLSGRYGPSDWSMIAEQAYMRHNADKIVAEQNYGGEMVRTVLQARNAVLPVNLVHASRGKVVRAEPVATLYDRGMMHHAGYFPELEEQLCGFTNAGYQGMKSPDRADAMVWGFTELFPGLTTDNIKDVWVPPNVITRPRNASHYGAYRR